MGTRVYNPGDVIYHEGEKISAISIVVKGNILISGGYNKVNVSSGHMLGITDVYAGEYIFEYVAASEVTVFEYSYTKSEDLLKMLAIKPELANIFVSTMFKAVALNLNDYEHLHSQCNSLYKFIKDNYNDYRTLCTELGANIKAIPEIDDMEPYEMKETVDPWLNEYYKKLHAVPSDMKKAFYGMSKSICYGTVMEAARHLVSIFEINNAMADYITTLEDILMNGQEVDLFNVYTGVSFKTRREKRKVEEVDAKIAGIVDYLQNSYFADKELIAERMKNYQERLAATDFSGNEGDEGASASDGKQRADLVDSLETILEYAMVPDEYAKEFKDVVAQYKAMPDKNIVDSESRAIRKRITKMFFELYEIIALRTFNDFGYPTVIKMFLYFGYVDEELAGDHNAEVLYRMAEKRRPVDETGGTFALIDWLRLIYEGKRDPSKSELDVDYVTFLREEKRSGRINEREEAALLQDNERKVKYELANCARSVNQVTFGRVSNYCPIFSEHNVIKALESMYVTRMGVDECLEKLRSIDYSAFYRECSYSDPSNGISKEFIQTEVLPDVVLMPNVGARGSMWQEYYGNYRNTPARFFLPIFCAESLEDILIRMTGEFRWELCRRIQGARWNDITDKSLTSEYSDYVQYYRKNSDLSPEAKEKIKLNLSRCRNSFKELFVREYMVWIKFESQGSARLNKVSRTILYNYCPFSPDIRETLNKNPMFTEIMERYKNRQLKKLHSVDLLFAKIEKEGGTITPELKAHREFIGR